MTRVVAFDVLSIRVDTFWAHSQAFAMVIFRSTDGVWTLCLAQQERVVRMIGDKQNTLDAHLAQVVFAIATDHTHVSNQQTCDLLFFLLHRT